MGTAVAAAAAYPALLQHQSPARRVPARPPGPAASPSRQPAGLTKTGSHTRQPRVRFLMSAFPPFSRPGTVRAASPAICSHSGVPAGTAPSSAPLASASDTGRREVRIDTDGHVGGQGWLLGPWPAAGRPASPAAAASGGRTWQAGQRARVQHAAQGELLGAAGHQGPLPVVPHLQQLVRGRGADQACRQPRLRWCGRGGRGLRVVGRQPGSGQRARHASQRQRSPGWMSPAKRTPGIWREEQ